MTVTTKKLSAQIEADLTSALGEDFTINVHDDMLIVLALTRVDVHVHIDTDQVVADVYGFAIPSSGYNEHMIESSGGATALVRQMEANGASERLVTTIFIDFLGDAQEDIGKAIEAIKREWAAISTTVI